MEDSLKFTSINIDHKPVPNKSKFIATSTI